MLYGIITAMLAGSGRWTYYCYLVFRHRIKEYKLYTGFVAVVFLFITYFWTSVTMDFDNIKYMKKEQFILFVFLLKTRSWINFYENVFD